MAEIVPLRSFARRLPEHGRIRAGQRVGKGMRALKTWRFTSDDPSALAAIAARYGGTVTPWTDGHDQAAFELVTATDTLDVILPPDPMGGTPIYEAWTKGGCQRRCDGEEALVPGPEGMEVTSCLCVAEGRLVCKPTTRLNVILPGVPLGGTWRYESKSWNAAHELPGTVDMLEAASPSGFVRAELVLQGRSQVVRGQTRHYTVPVLRTVFTVEELVAGAADMAAIGPGALRELPAGEPVPTSGSVPETDDLADVVYPVPNQGIADDEPVDAELVDDGPPPDVDVTLLAVQLDRLELRPAHLTAVLKAAGGPIEDLDAVALARLDAAVTSVNGDGRRARLACMELLRLLSPS